jgi:hypothetical protein
LRQVGALNLDPEAGRFGSSREVRIKIATAHPPVAPESTVPSYLPAVEFTGTTLSASSHPAPGERDADR